MCNNSPAEATSPENGWRSSVLPILDRWNRAGTLVVQGPYVPVSRGVQWCALKGLGVSLPGAATGTDLGGSSKYSSEILEGRRGEGFHVNSTCTWVSRS